MKRKTLRWDPIQNTLDSFNDRYSRVPSAADQPFKGRRSAWISREAKVDCPPISLEEIDRLTTDEPKYITRYIEARYLEAANRGYFRMNTLVNYRATEAESSGRLGDVDESVQQETIRPRGNYIHSGIVKDGKSTILMLGNKVYGYNAMDAVKTEFIANDYCVCATRGRFSLARGKALRENESDEDKKPDAYVTYDLAKLKSAIQKELRKHEGLPFLQMFCMDVTYGHKDNLWSVGEVFNNPSKIDPITRWLEIAFRKPRRFRHEDEFRLLAVDIEHPGGLDVDAKLIEFKDSCDISNAIVDSGVF